VPVVVGSLGRIPVGAHTDRFGGRVMFPVVSFAPSVPVLFLGYAGYHSLPAILIGGFFLGIGGTAFAVGVPIVNAWFPPEKRGLAIGVFGAGMGGTAISALTTVRLMKAHGIEIPFLITALVLVGYGIAAWLIMRDAPGRVKPTKTMMQRLAVTTRMAVTWQAATLYAVAFGGYVAFSVYLPTYLKTAYGLELQDAANRMAGFVLLAVLARPLGGWLSDRIAPTKVLTVVFAVVTVCAIAKSPTPALYPFGTIPFLVMATALGVGSGAVFAMVAQQVPTELVGGVTGFVGAAGGLGGFIPPLLMGSIYGRFHDYAGGLLALAVVAAACTIFCATRRTGQNGSAGRRRKTNKALAGTHV
jgi:NNP family nitrate/nitrite transporter-like MFS transporter